MQGTEQNLFSESSAPDPASKYRQPLAARMRPQTLDDFAGQEHILGPGKLLRRLIEEDRLTSSLILWGPPGCGKTSLANIIAHRTQARFVSLSAVLSGVKDVRQVAEEAREAKARGRRTVVLIDEIHRFNKSQQDALLPHVENGNLLLIGATTENPFFEVNQALLSRSRIFRFQSLSLKALSQLLQKALRDPERGYGKLHIKLTPEATEHLLETACGDGRRLLNYLEMAVESAPYNREGGLTIDLDLVKEATGEKSPRYDKGGDQHYDTISAFIKSVRGSDPDAALFWLARMLNAGEDPKFIMRRLLILAGEDIGLADPQAITITASCATALEWVGLPEAKYHLALATLYLATAPKSNSTCAYFQAEKTAAAHPDAEVPLHLRDSHYRGAARLGHGRGYRYPHDYQDHYVPQAYLPPILSHIKFYVPGPLGYEKKIAQRIEYWNRRKDDATR